LNNLDLLKELCALPGISGHEGPVTDRIQAALKPLGFESHRDRIGNLVARIPGNGCRGVLFAHMDEVGLIVRRIHPAGFIYVERVGGASTQVLPGQRVHLWTEEGPIPGAIGARHQHVSDPQETIDLANLYIDIGAASRDQVLNRGIQVGTPVTYAAGFDVLDGRVSGKSLDDRLGCFLLLSLAEQLRSQPLPVDLSLVFVVQEEMILTGAVPAIYDLEPDWAIGLDATLAFDTPDLTGGQNDIALGEGTVIKVMDHLRGQGLGFISHLGLRQHVERTARERGIRFQREVVTGLSTAATPLPYLRSGLPVAAVSFPLRYAHSPVEMVDLGDAQASLDLLAGLVFQPWDG